MSSIRKSPASRSLPAPSTKEGCSYATVSMPPSVMDSAKARAASLGLKFSQYVALLVRKDQASRGEGFTIDAAPAAPTAVKRK